MRKDTNTYQYTYKLFPITRCAKGLFHYACSPLVDIVLIIIFTLPRPHLYTKRAEDNYTHIAGKIYSKYKITTQKTF